MAMHSFDTTFETFADDVLDASNEVPVLVDFWASWCGPCKQLMPVLTKLADEYQGGFKLAKVNIDEQQQLAQQFRVRSVPTVKVVKNGQVVDEFLGAQPESQIRALLDKYVVRESDKLMAAALERYNNGDAGARQDMIAIVNSDPHNNNLRLLYVDVLMREKEYDDARTILQSLPPDIRQQPEIAGLLGRLEFLNTASDGPDEASLRARIEADPADCEARYQLSSFYITQARYQDAMDQLLEIMKHDRKYGDDAGRKGILKVFDMLGGRGELVSRYRQKMAALLY
ncbi:MAG: thioredoxin [Gammaproteobacteria bacterium]|nr:thioredoxin [Gammaproteobacteria bacterium]